MIQGHSIPIAEPVAQTLAFTTGLIAYGIASLVTHDHNTRLWAALLCSILTNVLIGAKINVFCLDLLSLVVVRPLSAGAGAAALAAILNHLAQ